MQLNSFLLITFVANVLAIKNHNVSVGNAAGDNIFEPASIDAEVGDIVTFICRCYRVLNRSVRATYQNSLSSKSQRRSRRLQEPMLADRWRLLQRF
jgi:plastocyanin